MVPGSIPSGVTGFFSHIFLPTVDSAPSENEYQQHFLGVKAAGAWGWQPHHLHVPNVMESASLNLLEPSGPNRDCYGTPLYRVSQEEWTKLRESVPYVKLYRYNPKHLYPKLNGYGDKGQRKVWSFCGSTYCTWFAWRNTHTLRIVRPCLQLAQARSSLRLHM